MGEGEINDVQYTLARMLASRAHADNSAAIKKLAELRPEYLEETIALMFMYPHVYAGLGAINWGAPREEFHYYLRRLLQAGLGKRLMFGSDAASYPELYAIAIEAIETADFLTGEQKRDIFYNNAVRFLRLEEEVQ